MNKRFLITAGSILILGLLTGASYFWWVSRPARTSVPTEQELETFAARVNPKAARHLREDRRLAQSPQFTPIPSTRRIRIALGWLGLPDEPENRQVSDLIIAQLSADKNLELVDRAQLDTALQETAMSYSGLVRADTAIRAGKLLRADWFLMGTGRAIQGTNYLAVRIIDTRTGGTLDIAALPGADGPVPAAAHMTAFLRRCRANASLWRPRTYLAVGEIRDVGLNDRQIEFQSRLRSYLTTSLAANTNVTLLERVQVEMLLHELQLDLAGFTEEGTTNPPAPLRPAFWEVSGEYQPYGDNNSQVDLVLTVKQFFNKSWETNLRGSPEQPLFQQAGNAVNSILAQGRPFVSRPTRRAEINEQYAIAQKSSAFLHATSDPMSIYGPNPMYGVQQYASDRPRQERDLENSIRAYETILILDPNDLEAKFSLGACLAHPYIHRIPEARDYFREVANTPIDAGDRRAFHRKEFVMIHLAYSATNQDEALMWWTKLHDLVPSSGLYSSYIQGIQEARTPYASEEARLSAQLLKLLTGAEARWRHGLYANPTQGITYFLRDNFAKNPAAGIKWFTGALPDLKEKVPALAPYLDIAALLSQTNTNAPVVTRLPGSVDLAADHPDKILHPTRYFDDVTQPVFNWYFDKTLYSTAAQLMEAKRHAAAHSTNLTFTIPDQMRLAYGYMGMERWQDALTILGIFEVFRG